MDTGLRGSRVAARDSMLEATMQCGCSFVLTCTTYLHSRSWAPGLDKVDATLFVDGFGSEEAVGRLVRCGDGVAWRDETLLSFVSSRCSLIVALFP